MSDCPECEYCCAIGLCCPPAQQLEALTAIMVHATGKPAHECKEYAQAVVDARAKAQKHG